MTTALLCLLIMPTALDQNPFSKAVGLTSDMMKKGWDLIPKKRSIYLSPSFNFGIRNGIVLVDFNFNPTWNIYYPTQSEPLLKRFDDVDKNIEEMKVQQEVFQKNMMAIYESINTQNKIIERSFERQNELLALIYQSEKTKVSRMRKEKYMPGNTKDLVILISDFSSGDPNQGVEIANEISAQLRDMVKLGLKTTIVVGEIKEPIRSEEAARDLCSHYPSGTDILVIWGTMSPRTVGKYRPQMTYCRGGDNPVISFQYPLELESEKLPLPANEKYDTECYERLISTTCSYVPRFYINHEISNDRNPDLKKLFQFLGNDSNCVKELSEELNKVNKWSISHEKPEFSHLKRLTPITEKNCYPNIVWNSIDNSIMVLIADQKGDPIKYENKNSNKKEIVYIDASEVTNEQFANFFNAINANPKDLKGKYDYNNPEAEVYRDADGIWKAGSITWTVPTYGIKCPIVMVSWSGANDYCDWSKKTLPTVAEWRDAASGISVINGSSGCYRKCGSKVGDMSRIGCFDMGSNVSEWTDDWDNEKENTKKTCGGSYEDKKDERFGVNSTWPANRSEAHKWVGFRGVVRIPVE